MEAQILQDMILDRDRRIALLERKAVDQKSKAERLANELEEVHFRHADAKIARQGDKTRCLHEKATADQRLEELQVDLQQQGSSLATYSNILKMENTKHTVVDSNYVIKMQAQLCKAMHNMGIVDHQYKLVKDACDLNLKRQKETLAQLTEEKTKLELKMLNELMHQDNKRKDIEDELETQLNDLFTQISKVRREIQENRDSDQESDAEEDQEDTQEEKEAKEELTKLLEEKQKEIEALEKLTEEQLVQIDDLRAQLKGISEEDRKAEVEKKAQERAEAKESSNHASTPPASPKAKPLNPANLDSREQLVQSDDEDDVGDVPVHVPLQNEKVLELAKRRADKKAAEAAKSPTRQLQRQNSDEADEFDLLQLARMRLTGETNKAETDDSDEESENEGEEEEESVDDEEDDIFEESQEGDDDDDIQELDIPESPSTGMEDSENGHLASESEAAADVVKQERNGGSEEDADEFIDAADDIVEVDDPKVDGGTAETIESTDADEEHELRHGE